MSEHIVSEQRHRNMAAIKGRDTKPEMVVRRWLWGHGFRYRLNHPRLPGRPDVVLRKYRTCVFVNGCFWHGHGVGITETMTDVIEYSVCCKIPHTNRVFWVRKILRNKERDIEVQRKLAGMGWHCITVWECELRSGVREVTLERLGFTLNRIFLQDHGALPHSISGYRLPDDDDVVMAAESIDD